MLEIIGKAVPIVFSLVAIVLGIISLFLSRREVGRKEGGVLKTHGTALAAISAGVVVLVTSILWVAL